MSDDFANYERMRAAGASPHEIYLAAKDDGCDDITSVRMLRAVCDLSLREVKEVSGATEDWTKKQNLEPGSTVHWEGQSPDDGFYFMQARVAGVENGVVSLECLKRFRPSRVGLYEVPINGPRICRMPANFFDKSLVDRLAEAIEFWNEVTEAHRKAV